MRQASAKVSSAGESSPKGMLAMGRERETASRAAFTIDAPATHSGYDTRLSYTDGDSDATLSDGLYYTLTCTGYMGYGFVFDNDGVLRYEWDTDGYRLDRVLFLGGDMLTCVSLHTIARIDRLGRVTALYDLGDGYALHHDFNFGRTENELVVLATATEGLIVDDLILEIDLDDGDVRLLVDMKDLLPDYYAETRLALITDPFPYELGHRDWIHLNTIETMDGDGLLLSSRETSAIIKISGVHGEATLDYMIADEQIWEDTGYEDALLAREGSFMPQYGQHDTQLLCDDDPTDGQYQIILYNNNYFVMSSRNDWRIDLDPAAVSVSMIRMYTDYDNPYDTAAFDFYLTLLGVKNKYSYVYVYDVDEDAGTYSLAKSVAVPFSSIVSSAQLYEDRYVTCSGMAKVFGEYDEDGNLIREFSYHTMIQCYRVKKSTFEEIWFQ